MNEQHEFAVTVGQGIEQAVKDLPNCELIIADNASDPEAALANGQAMLERHVDLFIEYQQDEQTNNVLMDVCQKTGVLVIAIDASTSTTSSCIRRRTNSLAMPRLRARSAGMPLLRPMFANGGWPTRLIS